MHEIFSREPDPVEGMLRPPSPADNEFLRLTVYTRTRRVLQRRRRVRQLAYAAALFMSFAVGAGGMRMMNPAERGGVSSPVEVTGERGGVSPPVEVTGERGGVSPPVEVTGGLTPPRSPAPEESALEREWLAFDSENHRGELYRQAGDRYMTDENDPQSALRCYSNALDNGAEQDLAISSDDNWLLMAIKDARQKEKNYAKQGG